MGWEKRRNDLYYYRKRREGERVVSKYVGRGGLAEAVAAFDTLGRRQRELEHLTWQLEREEILDIDQAGSEAQEVILALTRAWLLTQGFHTHKGQWRRRRKHGQGIDC